MSAFLTDLWESIFTPGPTPSLLKAANASFLTLQVVLAALLYATYSVHFVVLSVLCAGLWWSVNWFAAELLAAQREEEAKKAALEGAKKGHPTAATTDDSDTEVEGSDRPPRRKKKTTSAAAAGGGGDVEVLETVGEVKQRGGSLPGTQSSVSTEDEWEKVSESEGQKDK
jgi:hypothetical protein